MELLQSTKRLKHLETSYSRKVEESKKNTRKTVCTRFHAQNVLKHMWANQLEPSRKEIKSMQIYAK